jgi:hypothetical protein
VIDLSSLAPLVKTSFFQHDQLVGFRQSFGNRAHNTAVICLAHGQLSSPFRRCGPAVPAGQRDRILAAGPIALAAAKTCDDAVI